MSYLKSECDNCGKEYHVEQGQYVSDEDINLCPYCYADYTKPEERKCGLCGETDKDISVTLPKFQVVGFETPIRVCATCIDYDTNEKLHQLIKKL